MGRLPVTIFDIGLFLGMTIALAVLQFAMTRLPLWFLKRANIGRRASLVVAHVVVAGALLFLLLPVNAVSEAVRWLALVFALVCAVCIDLASLRPRRRRSLGFPKVG